MTNDRTTVTECIGSVPWGTHLCKFHSKDEELADTLAPYFTAGLQQGQLCLWVTSDPSGVEGARTKLRKAAPYLDRNLDRGQIEIWDCRDWYLHGGHFDADRVFGQWVEKEKWSLDSGYQGLRVTGDMAWLEKRDWPDFMAYEAEVNQVLPQHRMIGLCTYPLDGCSTDTMLEVFRNHQFALGLTKQTSEWDDAKEILDERLRIETSVNRQLQRFSAYVLEQQDEERRWIAKQLHEVVAQNVSAIAIYLTGLQQGRSTPSEVEHIVAKCHNLCDRSLEQLLNLSHLLHPPVLDGFGLAAGLHRYIEDFMKRNRIHVQFVTGPDIGRLPLEVETNLFRVAQEGLSNVLLHSESLDAIVRLDRQEDQVILQIEDSGRGMPASACANALGEEVGVGIIAMQERLRQIGGRLEIRSGNQGTVLTASVRLS